MQLMGEANGNLSRCMQSNYDPVITTTKGLQRVISREIWPYWLPQLERKMYILSC